MSSRSLKKLESLRSMLKNDLIPGEDCISDSENSEAQVSKKQNRFDLLNQLSLSESEFKDETETEHQSGTSNQHLESTKKKKKIKKKRTKAGKPYRAKSSEDAEGEDEFTRTVKLFGESSFEKAEEVAIPVHKSLLQVQHKNLNSQHEMKRMFGNRVVQAEQNKRRNQRSGSGIRPKSTLVNPKESWPPMTKSGVYMNLVQQQSADTTKKTANEKNILYFAFEHSQSYRQLEQLFLTAVESSSSDNIIKIINQQPYHINSLIQLSEMCKMSEDHAMASELIEHAVYALETSFHSMFSLTQGNCRLDYRRQENRSMFVILFKHAQYLESRACARTSLEVSKLLLTLDPEDPLAMILILDFYALRSKQYEWLVQLYNEFNDSLNLCQLPNMAFSSALALFYSQQIEAADAAIQYALMMFPAVLKPLLDSLSVHVDSRVNSHKYFGPAAYTNQPLALQQLTSLYICRCKIVWSDAEILPWLERNVNIVLDQVDAKDEIVHECAAKRSQRYVNPPRPILRHIVLSDFKEKVPLANFLKKETDILMYDPLPPLDSINVYQRPKMASTSRVLNGSPFSMFFQSLLPSFNMQPPVDGAPIAGVAPRPQVDDGAVAEAAPGQSIAELRNSLNTIVDAMRDFLSDIRVMGPSGDADENESSDDDDVNNLT